jgi:hypothetical protein
MVEAIDPETLGLLASIGIEKGKRFAPDARMKKILVEAAAVGNATARANAYRTRLKEAYFYPNSAWCTPFVGGSYEFLDNGVRLLDARSFMFFYATGITPAMAWRVADLMVDLPAASARAGASRTRTRRPGPSRATPIAIREGPSISNCRRPLSPSPAQRFCCQP